MLHVQCGQACHVVGSGLLLIVQIVLIVLDSIGVVFLGFVCVRELLDNTSTLGLVVHILLSKSQFVHLNGLLGLLSASVCIAIVGVVVV